MIAVQTAQSTRGIQKFQSCADSSKAFRRLNATRRAQIGQLSCRKKFRHAQTDGAPCFRQFARTAIRSDAATDRNKQDNLSVSRSFNQNKLRGDSQPGIFVETAKCANSNPPGSRQKCHALAARIRRERLLACVN
jgi:hypothetical protein